MRDLLLELLESLFSFQTFGNWLVKEAESVRIWWDAQLSKEFYIPFDLENLMDRMLYTSVAHVVRVLILNPITGGRISTKCKTQISD